MTRNTDEAGDETTGPPATPELGWLPERVELPSDEWVIYPPGEPRPANFALRFEKTTPAVLVGTESGDAPGVHVLPHPGGLSVSARFGGIVDGSVREFDAPRSADERTSVVAWVRELVSRIDVRTEKARIEAACAPVPNAGDRAAAVLYEHFGSADRVAAAIVERDTAALRTLSGIAEQTASELVVHYGTDAEWEYYRRKQHDSAP
ncbi:hypothetical protein C440_02258 [Haloferax mucosum ATCC BAA-1512]|uniref:Uncharacterized protein n=1 Tax=Haloferax mucosum ATCC BAA-1512 TaxID=662479 RepID=M0IQE3_9EURY|nr:hypothetical protein [Haloferax mucosum]ELZ98033.1 hypothetical protein C440_02258 [Haloferax mucosum ATCC BAA-1512]